MATGFNFGGTAGGAGGGFNFGAKPTATATLSNPAATATSGFNFGLTKTTASTGLLATPASTATAAGLGGGFGLTSTPSLGFNLAGNAATATTTAAGATTGFGFNTGGAAATTSASTGFGLGSLGASTATAPAAATTTSTAGGLGGFNFAKPATTATGLGGAGTGLLGGTATSVASTGLGGGLFGATTTSTASAASIFNTPQTAKNVTGLGGVDPNAGLKAGGPGGTGSSSDGKALKETLLPDQLTETVHNLQKFVKEEKTVREDISRMSSKPMMKVQEDVVALRQLLSVVANGLQRNTCAVEKLKQEMMQNLKNAEMAQRTKDIPPGLQYENTAPTEYFQRLVQEFEESMVMYRQQIEALDSHLASLHQPSPQSPTEVITLMKKLHEAFLSLAAQLQQIHEAVKSQKDQFLTYRRVFHGDGKNVFHKSTPLPKPPPKKQLLSDLMGPTPFPSVSNAASKAMAAVLNRSSQQPSGGVGVGGPPIWGLTGMGQPGTFGASTGLFGANKPGLGFGAAQSTVGGSLFSTPSLLGTPQQSGIGGFGTPNNAAVMGSTSTAAALNLAGTNLNMSANTRQPFQLQKPPQGAKRGKR